MKSFGKILLSSWIVFVLGIRAREYEVPFFRVIATLLIIGAVWQLRKFTHEV